LYFEPLLNQTIFVEGQIKVLDQVFVLVKFMDNFIDAKKAKNT
jgi:hypothetical protein